MKRAAGRPHEHHPAQNPVQDGRPIISKVVEHAGIVYVCGILPDPVGDITTQTRQVLERIDEALRLAGTTGRSC